ncbi:hypothetical protein [Pseudomonas sp. MF6776]|uniref:hypothetical protein n=1 Tax=Pseudomonas sp. MF6776 TaxID=2797534 RepID=UPI00190B3315|nr:hypothetical protein [Pseudomonas sp. MF6776]MBK3468180.1 hypothetical protein [Pseudomonas sp. MF6776]
MPQMKRSDLHYDYKWTVTEHDSPKLISGDAHHLSRNEGYEMLHYLNNLRGKDGADLPLRSRQIVEWMLKEHFRSTAPGQRTVTEWVTQNWIALVKQYPW